MESWEPVSRIRNILLHDRVATFGMLAQRSALPPQELAHVLDRMEAEHQVTSDVAGGQAIWTLDR